MATVTLRSGAFSGLNWRSIRANNKCASEGGLLLLATESQAIQRMSKAVMVPRGCFGGGGNEREIDAESRAPWQQTSNQTQQQRLWSAGTPPRPLLTDICYTCLAPRLNLTMPKWQCEHDYVFVYVWGCITLISLFKMCGSITQVSANMSVYVMYSSSVWVDVNACFILTQCAHFHFLH